MARMDDPPKAELRAQLEAALATYRGPVTRCPPGKARNEGENDDNGEDDEPPASSVRRAQQRGPAPEAPGAWSLAIARVTARR